MGRKNHKKKISGIQNQDTHTLDNNNSKKRNLKLIYIIGVIVVLVVTFILFDNKSDTVSSIKQNSISNKSTKVSADNKQTTPINSQGPSIQFPEPSYDFGTISQGDKVSHTFIVRNAGNEPLKLIKAKGS